MIIYYCFLLVMLTFFMWIIVKHTKNKPSLQITLVDLINVDLSYSYFFTCFIAILSTLCIESRLLANFPPGALVLSHGFDFVSTIFMVYISVGIIVRTVLINVGHMELCCGLLDEQVRQVIRLVIVAFSKCHLNLRIINVKFAKLCCDRAIKV